MASIGCLVIQVIKYIARHMILELAFGAMITTLWRIFYIISEVVPWFKVDASVYILVFINNEQQPSPTWTVIILPLSV